MYVLQPITVTEAVLTASNIPETDYATWASGTTYAAGARVVAPSPAGVSYPRSIYESVAGGNQGTSPASSIFHKENNPAGKWIWVGATNRWRAFDGNISDRVIAAGDITFTLTLPSLCTGIAFFNLRASSVTVQIRDTADAVIWTRTRTLTNTDAITDWFEFFTWEPDLEPEAIFTGLPGYTGYKLDITLSGLNSRVGAIALGKVTQLGKPMPGTEIGFESYSRKERDDFGNPILIKRPYADTVTFQFTVPLTDLRRVKRVISSLESTPAVWFAGAHLTYLGATVFGFPTGGLRVPISIEGVHFASLELEGLT
ncbi:hypothetical protein [Rubellimicrobium arenae]|uniref:hypothetical protein n=1 Tax=Rubellimicrobium arenae TaxID=2817372 RepID=UPI001B30A1F9|nr:hypothetical protein [Rubellimicrobium arenae]